MPPLEKRATLTPANDDEEAAAWDTVGCYLANNKSGAEDWWDLYWTEDDDIAEVSIGR